MRLETNRLILRLWGKEDEQRLFELAKNPNVGPPCGWIAHQNLEESQMVLQDILLEQWLMGQGYTSLGMPAGLLETI